jgi:hypothetical protein
LLAVYYLAIITFLILMYGKGDFNPEFIYQILGSETVNILKPYGGAGSLPGSLPRWDQEFLSYSELINHMLCCTSRGHPAG